MLPSIPSLTVIAALHGRWSKEMRMADPYGGMHVDPSVFTLVRAARGCSRPVRQTHPQPRVPSSRVSRTVQEPPSQHAGYKQLHRPAHLPPVVCSGLATSLRLLSATASFQPAPALISPPPPHPLPCRPLPLSHLLLALRVAKPLHHVSSTLPHTIDSTHTHTSPHIHTIE